MKRDDKFSPVKNSPNVVVVVVAVVVVVVAVVGSSLFKACETKLWFQVSTKLFSFNRTSELNLNFNKN